MDLCTASVYSDFGPKQEQQNNGSIAGKRRNQNSAFIHETCSFKVLFTGFERKQNNFREFVKLSATLNKNVSRLRWQEGLYVILSMARKQMIHCLKLALLIFLPITDYISRNSLHCIYSLIGLACLGESYFEAIFQCSRLVNSQKVYNSSPLM